MNKQDILQNMTKGPWTIADLILPFGHHTAIWGPDVKDGEQGLPVCLLSPKEKESIRDLANGNLILMMKRETIDKGINPESVEKMRKMLERCFKWISSASQERASILHDIEEALTAAKLD